MIKSITFRANSVLTRYSSGDDVQIIAEYVDKESLKQNIEEHLMDIFTVDELKAIISEVEND